MQLAIKCGGDVQVPVQTRQLIFTPTDQLTILTEDPSSSTLVRHHLGGTPAVEECRGVGRGVRELRDRVVARDTERPFARDDRRVFICLGVILAAKSQVA